MPNSIKYSASAQTLALKKGNFFIGTGDVGKGPTDTSGYWDGISPPNGGYTIYLTRKQFYFTPTIKTSRPGIIACCGAFDGYLSVVRVYNRALSESEITKNFNAQKTHFGL